MVFVALCLSLFVPCVVVVVYVVLCCLLRFDVVRCLLFLVCVFLRDLQGMRAAIAKKYDRKDTPV